MSILLPTSRTLIVLPTKTGSSWLRAALKASGVHTQEVGSKQFGGHDDLSEHDLTHVGACSIVRNPIDWYRSYWAYRMERGWRPKYDLDRLCGSNNFTVFIRNVVVCLPGFVTAMFERYVGPVSQPIPYILKQERLSQDLASLLYQRGENFNIDALLATPRINITKIKPEIDEATRDTIIFMELPMLRRFDYRDADVLGGSDAITLADRYPDDERFLQNLLIWTEQTHWKFDDEKRRTGKIYDPAIRYTRIYCNYALFLLYEKRRPDEAEAYFDRALSLTPLHPRTLANYAIFLHDYRNDALEAERLLLRALDARPDHLYARAVLAQLLRRIDRSVDAERHDNIIRSRGYIPASIIGTISGTGGGE